MVDVDGEESLANTDVHVHHVLQSLQYEMSCGKIALIISLNIGERTECFGVRYVWQLTTQIHTNLGNESGECFGAILLLDVVERSVAGYLHILVVRLGVGGEHMVEAIVEVGACSLECTPVAVVAPDFQEEKNKEYDKRKYAEQYHTIQHTDVYCIV